MLVKIRLYRIEKNNLIKWISCLESTAIKIPCDSLLQIIAWIFAMTIWSLQKENSVKFVNSLNKIASTVILGSSNGIWTKERCTSFLNKSKRQSHISLTRIKKSYNLQVQRCFLNSHSLFLRQGMRCRVKEIYVQSQKHFNTFKLSLYRHQHYYTN